MATGGQICTCERKVDFGVSQSKLNHGGSFGEMFNGTFERTVDAAVKRIHLTTYFDGDVSGLHNSNGLYESCDELTILKKVNHKNVIRYFCTELHDCHNMCMAMELCHYDLDFFAKAKREDFEGLTNQDVMTQLIDGLVYLHSIDVVHGDLQPGHIFLRQEIMNGIRHFVLKIAEFSLAQYDSGHRNKQKKDICIRKKPNARFCAPELRSDVPVVNKVTSLKPADVYSAGLIFNFVLNNGEIIFLMEPSDHALEDRDLSGLMVSTVPEQRPNVIAVRKHPALWNTSYKVRFIQEFAELAKKDEQVKGEIEMDKRKIGILDKWLHQIKDENIKRTLFPKKRKFGGDTPAKYNPTVAVDVFRAFRNLTVHFLSQPADYQASIGSSIDNFASIWFKTFPNMLMYAYEKAEELVRTKKETWSSMESFVSY